MRREPMTHPSKVLREGENPRTLKCYLTQSNIRTMFKNSWMASKKRRRVNSNSNNLASPEKELVRVRFY